MPLTFAKQFSCGDITSGPSSYFKFNATNQYGFSNETPNTSMILDPDLVKVTLFGSGNGVVLNRSGVPGLLQVQVNDTENSNSPVPAGVWGAFNVTTNDADWDAGVTNQTDSSGVLSYNFVPVCSPLYQVGVQKWRGGTFNDSCYQPVYSFNYSLNVTGQLKENLAAPAYGSSFNTSNSILLRYNVTSECAAEGTIANASTAVSLLSPLNVSIPCTPVLNESGGSSGFYNCSWSALGQKQGNWTVQVSSSDSPIYLSNSTNFTNWFYLQQLAVNASGANVTPYSGGWSRPYNFSVSLVKDTSLNTTCSLWVSTDNASTWVYEGNSTISGNGSCWVQNDLFTCGALSNWTFFKFNVNDGEANNTFNTSPVRGPILSPSVAQVQYVSGNTTSVNRSGVNVDLLVLSAFDVSNQSYITNNSAANFSFWVTVDGSGYGPANVSSLVNGSGVFNLSFDPTCSYNPGRQFWVGGITGSCYANANSTPFNLSIIATST